MNLLELLDFFEPPVSIGFDVAPEQALEYFYAKGLSKSISYADLSAAEHLSSFTVAKMMDMDLLADVKTSLEKAMAEGVPFKAWAKDIIPTLQAKGWWGKDEGGAQLGTPWRLETIFRTNMQSAYAVGEWQQIKDQEEVAPFLMYDAVDDFRTRPEHAAMDGKIHPVDSPFWRHYHPPNGWNCRCSVIQLSQEEVDDLGLEVSAPEPLQTYNWTNPRTGKVEKVAVGTDPGFDFNPGQARWEELQKLAAQKAAAMSPDAARAAQKGLAATREDAAAVLRTAVQAVQGAAKLSSASNAIERAAAAQIQKAIAEKTPYLAKALQQIKAAKGEQPGTATELLAMAKEKAAKAEASASLYHYKQAVLSGKAPPAKAQQAFDALPDEAQQSITDLLNQQVKAAAVEKAAADEILAMVANPNSVAAKALTKIDLADKPKVQVLDELKAAVAAQKAKQSLGIGIAGFKKAMLANKVPTPAQKAAVDALTPEEKDALILELTKAKAKQQAELEAAKPSAPPPAEAAIPAQQRVTQAELDPDDLVQTGPQAGSNPGGEYTDTGTGIRWYLKHPDNVEVLRNEALAARLYQLAGVDMPDVRLIQFRGKPAIASRIIDGLKVDRAALTAGRVGGVQEHFGVDAWLANWDAVGPDYANTKLNALGRGVRIDPGGALRFRAQGGMKGAAFGGEVLDLESMRNTRQNPHAAAVFQHVTRADIEDGVRRILAIPEDQIRAAVDEFGPLDVVEREKLLSTLLARRQDLAKKYPGAAPQRPEPLPDARVTAADQAAIEAARANGMTIPTDSDVIEDHQVMVTTLQGPDGKPRTRVTLKVRPLAGQKLQSTMAVTSQKAEVLADLTDLKSKALEFLKGVGALAKKGEPLRDKDLARASSLLSQAEQMHDKLWSAGKLMADPDAGLRAAGRIQKLQEQVSTWVKEARVGQPAKALATFDVDTLPSQLLARAPTPQSGAKPWKVTGSLTYNLAKIERGRIIETDSTTSLPSIEEVRELAVDGGRVRYVPYGKGNSITTEGYMQIDLDGAGIDVTRKAFAVFDEIGLPATRPTELDRMELYLERIAAIRTLRNAPLTRKLEAARKLPDQQARTDAMLEALNADAGFDMRTSPNWDPQGRMQAFGHGRTLQMRPDLDQKELADFAADHVVYHNPSGLGLGGASVWDRLQQLFESGGQLVSQLDRVRRGISPGGSSVSADLNSGGGAYVFTRILRRSTVSKYERPAGVYWRANQLARLDAFSYDGDVFGGVARDLQERRRARDLKGMAGNAAKGNGNETNFRDSLSLFDDVEKIVLNSRTEYERAAKWLRANGYSTWPDGRKLEDVLDWHGRK